MPKTRAATTAPTASMVAPSAPRTGTAVRPRPGSNAIWVPMAVVTTPARDSIPASRDGRAAPSSSAIPRAPPARRATRQAAGASAARGSSATPARPASSTGGSALRPGCGSAARAGPIGISGDTATARATATIAPPVVTMASRARAAAVRWARVMPTARRMGNSAASSATCRASSWPRTASAMTAASTANSASAIACGWMADCVVATLSARVTVAYAASGMASRRRSASASRTSAATLAPGRSRRPSSGRLVMLAASRVRANGGLSSTRGCFVVVMAGTTLSSKVATPVTRKVSGTASFMVAAPEASLGMPISRSVSPGRRCCRAAMSLSMTASPGAPAANSVPCVTFTVSPVTPSESSGLAKTCTWVSGWAPGTGSAALYSVARDAPATCGRRASAAKNRSRIASAAGPPAVNNPLLAGGPPGSGSVTMTVTSAALAHCSSRG